MILVITGTKECKDFSFVELAIEAGLEKLGIKPTKIIHGDGVGVEKLVSQYAEKHGINCEKMLPKWKDIKGVDPSYIKENKYGKYNSRAAIIRNQKMLDKADALIAIEFHTNECRSIINEAKKRDLLIYVYEPEETDHDYGYQF